MSQAFIITKQHRRFTEFANAVRGEKTIGICHGDAGVGKTNSARRHAHWDTLEPYLDTWGPRSDDDAKHYTTRQPCPHGRLHPRSPAPAPKTAPRHRPLGQPPRHLHQRTSTHCRQGHEHPRRRLRPLGRTAHRRQSRTAYSHRPGDAPRSTRPHPARHDPHRHARHRPTVLPPAGRQRVSRTSDRARSAQPWLCRYGYARLCL